MSRTPYTPAYFERLGRYYQRTSRTAREFGHLTLLCNRLYEAGTHLMYAATALKAEQQRTTTRRKR